ncbi:hypothetical protein GCM10009775_25340 [Microbacterium aoyamense]|uniref:DUF2076 domain-containing protein n=1 Tax=Microbacterium aoyamense TaxID=344166 RepID=A0ABP5B7V3_9MICO|nr:hypothetical protein [Microbacterium aoyamense]
MGFLSRFRRRTVPYAAVTEEEKISRYVYLLNTLPASVIESAHATAFADLPAAQRREMFEQLKPFMAESERDAASDDPIVLARLLRRAEEHRAQRAAGGTDAAATTATATAVRERDGVDSRDVLVNAGVMGLVANQILVSSVIAVYFTQGAGSIGIDAEPGWVGSTFDPGSAGGTGWDGGPGGLDGGGHDGGGYDGGGFGGFDGGGFGGGFDGGGGM